MAETFTTTGGVQLALDIEGIGKPVVFQHGLCGDAAQPAGVFPKTAGFQRLSLECRGHGASEAGPLEALSLVGFTYDLGEMIVSRGIPAAVVGGISMGAAISLRLAITRPEMVRALVLARPAWLTEAAPENLAAFKQVGSLLQEHTPAKARELFESSPMAHQLADVAPDNLASLRGFFDRTPQATTAALLSQIASDGIGVTEDEVRSLRLPVLVIGNEQDYAHPMSFARTLANMIPDAQLVEITPKALDPEGHARDFSNAFDQFLKGL